MSREAQQAVIDLDRAVRDLPPGPSKVALQSHVEVLIRRLPDVGMHDIGVVIERDRAGV